MNKNDELFIDIYYRLQDKLKTKSDKYIHTLDKEYEIIKYEDTDLYDYLELSYINEDTVTTTYCTRYRAVKECTVIFDANVFITNILKSYKYSTSNIWSQFDADLPRTDVYINDKQITEKKTFLEILSKFKDNVYKFNDYKYDLLTIIALFCNQSSYALPYIMMTRIYADMIKNMISNISDNRKVKISITENNGIKFNLESSFGVKEIDTSETTKVINTNLELELTPDKLEAYISNRYGILNWNV